MFSSCCRCINKKPVLKDDEQLSENESDDSKSEKVPTDSNLIQKIPLRDPNATTTKHTNGVKTDINVSITKPVNVIDTVIKEEAEEDITSPSEPASLIDKGKNNYDDIDGEGEINRSGNNVKEIENICGGDSSIQSANTLNLLSNASSNISDEEKQKILEQQQQASTDNEDDGIFSYFYIIT